MVIKAYNPTYDIKAKNNIYTFNINNYNFPFFTRRAVVNIGNLSRTGTTRATINRNISLLDGSYRSVVYAARAMDFCVNNNVPIAGGLTIWPNDPLAGIGTGSAFFMPNSLLYGLVPITLAIDGRPGMYLSSGATGDENTVYHEFGHYLMWRLQQRNWIDPLSASFVDYTIWEEENANVAWTEGWANGFMAICDMANYDTDEEFQRELNWNWELRRNFAAVNRGYEVIYLMEEINSISIIFRTIQHLLHVNGVLKIRYWIYLTMK